jgi:two-component system response regulator DegU
MPSPHSVKLAIVDDHQLFRQGLSYILSRFPGYEVVLEASSGPELFTRLAAGLQPDVVLLDLHMREMNGREVSRKLLDEYPLLKIIILSMDYSHDFILDLMSLGVHGYLPKDIDQRLLSDAIEQVQTNGYYISETVAHVMRAGLQSRSDLATLKAMDAQIVGELSEREREVLTLLCQGYSSSKIAERLFISFRTVDGHRKRLLEKTGASNAVSLALFAIRNHLLGKLA